MAGKTERAWIGTALAALTLAVMSSGCLYDEANRCAVNQQFDEVTLGCVCVATAVLKDGACQPCGENEVGKGAACECKAGFTRNASNACVAASAALGAACTPGAAGACADATYNFCAAGSGGAGYCTKKGCTKHEECDSGWTCTTWEAAPYCKRAPSGIDKMCASSADCAGLEASSCDTFSTKKCQVAGCTLAPSNCHAGTECCDFSKFGAGTACVATGTCPKF